MKTDKLKRITAVALAMAFVFSAVPAAFADDAAITAASTEVSDTAGSWEEKKSILTYGEYLVQNADKALGTDEIFIYGKDFTSKSDETKADVITVDGKTDVLNWESQNGEITFEFDVKTAGLYNLLFSYEALSSPANEIEFELAIDGELPYDTAERLTLSKVWVNETEIKQDFNNNDIRPGQVEKVMWQTAYLEDVDGLYNGPLEFYLPAGHHTLTISSTKARFAIEYIKVCREAAPQPYVAPSDSELAATNGVATITLEGEKADYKSDRTLFPTSDRTSYLTSPSDPTKTKYNTIGKDSWAKAGQEVTWKFHVDKSGYYKIGIRARQSTMRGFYSNRKLYIDGVCPNAESQQLKFDYTTDWTLTVPKTESGDTVYYYLEAGDHTLTLESVPGEIGEIMDKLDGLVQEINDYYREIRQITGPDPDEYTDYNIDTIIPEVRDDFKRFSNELKDLQKQVDKLMSSGGNEAVTLNEMSIILDKCVKDPWKIASLMSQIKDNVTALSSWMLTYREQPLELDFVEITAPDEDFTSVKSSFFASLKFNFLAFIGSFFEDYNTLSAEEGKANTLSCWITLGRDQAQVVRAMIENDYNPTADTKVALKLVQGGILESTLAGKGPDIGLFMGGDYPIQLAARDLIIDISGYEGYDETIKQFSKDAMTLYTYNDGVYALPIQQNFPMMFYREDILSEYGIDGATDIQTWDDLIGILPTLQRNYLEVGLILPANASVNGTTTVPTTTEAGNTFAALMLQQGLNFYNDELTQTNFDNQIAIDAFEMWTEFYTKYSFQQSYDALTRFRTGEMPVVIQGYTFYNTLAVTAPEIKGAWNFTLIPGTERPDGTISHASNSGGSGAVIFSACDDYEAAWDFIKWFTSTEAQVEYSNDIEAVLGTLGRFDTANIEALKQLSWSQDELDLLLAQLDQQVEIPIIPATYGVTRNLVNAFRAVVNDADNARDTLMWYNRDINAEIIRKREDLGLPV